MNLIEEEGFAVVTFSVLFLFQIKFEVFGLLIQADHIRAFSIVPVVLEALVELKAFSFESSPQTPAVLRPPGTEAK